MVYHVQLVWACVDYKQYRKPTFEEGGCSDCTWLIWWFLSSFLELLVISLFAVFFFYCLCCLVRFLSSHHMVSREGLLLGDKDNMIFVYLQLDSNFHLSVIIQTFCTGHGQQCALQMPEWIPPLNACMYYRCGTCPTQCLLNIKHFVVISAIPNNCT